MIRKILARNIVLFAIVAVVLAKTIDWNDCFIKRGKYLLGIVYNGNLQNKNDTLVYEDYLKRHGSTHQEFQKHI